MSGTVNENAKKRKHQKRQDLAVQWAIQNQWIRDNFDYYKINPHRFLPQFFANYKHKLNFF